MNDDQSQRIADLEARLAQAELVIDRLRQMQVAEESGGGQVFESGGNFLIRLNALTAGGAQIP